MAFQLEAKELLRETAIAQEQRAIVEDAIDPQ